MIEEYEQYKVKSNKQIKAESEERKIKQAMELIRELIQEQTER